ncbi:MAG: hypothetical protein HY943_21255 [Gammaproteobacteria bacterium]|nr:hypothetical protein [Gammaproteobacteria bacterium]
MDVSVLAARTNDDDRYFTDEFQAMPRDGYTAMFRHLLDHPGIAVELGADYRSLRSPSTPARSTRASITATATCPAARPAPSTNTTSRRAINRQAP